MGVITVEKCLFYLEPGETQAKDPRAPLMTDGKRTRRTNWLRCVRLPWIGGLGKTMGYLHDDQIGVGSHRRIGMSTKDVRDVLLGKGWPHPKLVVADVPEPRLLMPLSEISKKLVDFAKMKNRLPSKLTYRGLRDRKWEVWLPWDPTVPGKQLPKFSTTLRKANEVLHKPVRSAMKAGRRPTAQSDREMNPVPLSTDAVTLVGAAYRLQYHPVAPPDVRWDRDMQRRVNEYLKSTGVKRGSSWYAIGLYNPAEHGRFRGGGERHGKRLADLSLHTYHPGVGVVHNEPGDPVVRKLFRVEAPDVVSAQMAVRDKIAALKRRPGLRDMALDKELAWSRTGGKVVSASAWDVQMRKKGRLDEESYRRLLNAGVY